MERKLVGGHIGGGRPEQEMSWQQDICTWAAWERVHWERMDEEAGCWE